MHLVPFDPARAAVVSSWARSQPEVRAWCGHAEAPVLPEVVAGWGKATGVTAYTLVEDTQLIGYGELWVDDDEAEVELARLIIEPGHRGRGYGRRLVRELVALARRQHQTVVVRVHPDNVVAQRSYAAAGFARVTAAEEAAWNAGQPVRYVWMIHRGG
jgi:ribosomal protein S18 acetylase RimI-like enzyme